MMDAEEYRRLVLRDLHDEASDQEADSLRDSEEAVREWRDSLVRMVQDTDSALARIATEVSDMRQACLRKGPKGKTEFFTYEAARNRERLVLVRQKSALVERLKEAKAALHEFAVDTTDMRDGRMARIEAKVDRLLALVEQLREGP